MSCGKNVHVQESLVTHFYVLLDQGHLGVLQHAQGRRASCEQAAEGRHHIQPFSAAEVLISNAA